MNRPLKILFVRPKPSPLTIGLQHVMIVEPLELEVMAALTHLHDEVHIVDMIFEKEPVEYFMKKLNPDLFCITGYITHIRLMIEYCRRAKSASPGVVTIAGGVHVEKCPDDCRDEAIDYRVIRNATRSFPSLLDFLRNGQNHPFPSGILKKNEIRDANNLPPYDFYYPIPRRDLTDKYRKNYFYVFHDRVALLKTSFGCPYQCTFCFCRKITDDHYHVRPMGEVMHELELIREKEIYIVDDNFLFSPQRVSDFINELRRRKLDKRFLVYGRADFITAYPELVAEFKKQGLRTVIIGLESFNDEELHHYNKKLLSANNEKAMEVLNSADIDCYAAIILSPSWGVDDFRALQNEIKKLKIRFVNLQPLTPLPLTGIKADEKDRIISRNDFPLWDLAHVIIRPSKLSIQNYYRMMIRTYSRTFFQWSHILHHLKYPVHMHWRMMKGVFRVYRQYHSIMKEAGSHA